MWVGLFIQPCKMPLLRTNIIDLNQSEEFGGIFVMYNEIASWCATFKLLIFLQL